MPCNWNLARYLNERVYTHKRAESLLILGQFHSDTGIINITLNRYITLIQADLGVGDWRGSWTGIKSPMTKVSNSERGWGVRPPSLSRSASGLQVFTLLMDVLVLFQNHTTEQYLQLLERLHPEVKVKSSQSYTEVVQRFEKVIQSNGSASDVS